MASSFALNDSENLSNIAQRNTSMEMVWVKHLNILLNEIKKKKTQVKKTCISLRLSKPVNTLPIGPYKKLWLKFLQDKIDDFRAIFKIQSSYHTQKRQENVKQ